MKKNRTFFVTISFVAAALLAAVLLAGPVALAQSEPQANASSALARRIGVVKSINGNAITVTPDSGSDIAVTVQPNARLLRIEPGAKDLKSASPVQLSDIKVGDRVRVRGQASADLTSMTGLEVIVMAQSDVAAHHEQEQEDWQKRGMGGLVSTVDPASGTVTISVTGFGGKKSIPVHTSKSTIFRRYAPNSVKFEDASASSIADIHPGDQLRARGDRSADGTELTALEVVTGSFRNVAGTVNSVDASSGTVTVQDVLSKKSVQVKITPDSQMHQLPSEMAQRIATRLKVAMGGAVAGTPGAGSGQAPTAGQNPARAGATGGAASGGPGGSGNQGMGGGMRSGGTPDFQQMLSRMPAVSLSDLHKGDAVMLVTTEGSPGSAGTAITLLSGVEPILRAAPNGSQAMMLTPWSLGGGMGGDAGAQ